MKSTSFYAAKSLKILWTLFAVLLVMFAACISILRYSLPYLDNHKQSVHSWISAQYGIELTFGRISADWSGSAMSLSLHDVQLQQGDETSPVQLYVEETQVELDFWASVINRELRSQRFDLKGMRLSVDMAQMRTSNSDAPVVSALESLFLNQLQRFSVSEGHLILKTANDQQDIELQQLSWVNKGERHQGVGQFRVDELANNSAFFALDLYGTNKNLHGSFYAEAEELDLAPWVKQWVKSEYQVKKSRGNFVAWAGIAQSKVTDVQLRLFDSEFTWQNQQQTVSTKVKSGLFTAQPNVQGWDFNLNDLLLQFDQQTWLTSWLGHLDSQGVLTIASDERFTLSPLLSMLPLFVPDQHLALLDGLAVDARVNRITALADQKTFKLNAEFDQLSWQQYQEIPGLTDLSGQFSWQNGRGNLQLESQSSLLSIDNLFEQNIPYQHLSLNALIANSDGWRLEIPELQLDSDLVQINSALSYQFNTEHLTIAGQLSALTVDQAKQLFPTEHMGPNTRRYLMRSLQAGDISKANMLWRGNPKDYPFRHNEGIFQAELSVENGSFAFDKKWPSLTEMDAELLFQNKQLSISSEKAKLLDVQVFGAKAHVPELSGSSYVSVEVHGRADASAVTEVMLQGSLANSVGKVLDKELVIADDLSADLSLHIPLDGENIIVKGDVMLANNPVYVNALNTTLQGTAGVVSFENKRVKIQSMITDLLGQSISIDAVADDTDDGYKADLSINANWQVQPLLRAHQPGLINYLIGNSEWQADVDLLFPKDGYQYLVEWRSDLIGLDSDLPAPFAINPTSGMAALVTVEGNQQASKVDATLGEKIRFNGIVPHKEMQFSRASLAVGDLDVVNMGLGFSITANVDEMGFEDWFTTINDFVEGLPDGGSKPLLGQPNRIYVNAKNMLIAGQKVEDLALIAKHTDDSWQLSFNSEQARADMVLAKDWFKQGISVDADFIHLHQWQEDKKREPNISDYQNLPPIQFSCDECKWQDKNFGKVAFKLTPVAEGMQIDTASMQNRHGKVEANGLWAIDESASQTHLSGRFDSNDFGAFLKDLGFDSGIKDSESRLDFDLSWQNAPHEFNFDSLNGDLKWNLTDGYLTEVSDRGVRILSLFSVESLVRKLSLDFRDVFAKGFFYDRMRGDFHIIDGKAHTENSVIDGGAGEMTIAGTTDLVSQQLNYQIGFTPNVTSSLPLLMYFMVNPAVAIASFAIDEALTEAKVISHVRYSVTGTIQEPITTQISRDAKDISLPARNQSPETPSPAIPKQAVEESDETSNG